MTLLSLDTSTTSTGYAIYVDGQYSSSACFDLKKYKDEKLPQMIKLLFSLIDKLKPNIIVAEEMVVPRNPQTARLLTMLLGALYGKCLVSNIEWFTLRPTQWRKFAKNNDEKLPRKRDELKAWSKAKVKSLFNIDVNDDVSDAILIGYGFIKEYINGKN